MKKISYFLLFFFGFSSFNNLAQADNLLPIKKIKPEKIMTYDFTGLESHDITVDTRALPSSSILVYNVFTADDNWFRDLDYYSRYFKLKHSIHFCNITVKSVTTYAKWKVEGPQPWQSDLFKIQVEPKKCHIYYMDVAYDNDGIYLFTGFVIPKGIGQNAINSDTSKFRIR